MKIYFAALGLLLVTMQSAHAEYGYIPQRDPFVLKYFEHYLAEAGVKYEKNEDGYYVAPEKIIDEIMIPLGQKASKKNRRTNSLVIKSDCGLFKLKQHLNNLGVIYYVYQDDGQLLLKTTQADTRNFKIIEHYSMFDNECQKRI
ncbi:MAG: hypothetical protein V7752_19615 [Halopseudomonas sp.]